MMMIMMMMMTKKMMMGRIKWWWINDDAMVFACFMMLSTIGYSVSQSYEAGHFFYANWFEGIATCCFAQPSKLKVKLWSNWKVGFGIKAKLPHLWSSYKTPQLLSETEIYGTAIPCTGRIYLHKCCLYFSCNIKFSRYCAISVPITLWDLWKVNFFPLEKYFLWYRECGWQAPH